MKEQKEEQTKKEKKVEVSKPANVIVPLKDFVIKHNEFFYELKKGQEIEVDKKFLPNLKTEKVIK